MSSLALREIAVALGGEVSGRQVLAPGPNHARTDRSLSVRLSAQSPGGFVCHSFAGDPFDACRDYVAAKLGILAFQPSSRLDANRPALVRPSRAPAPEPDHAARIARAVALWHESTDAHGTIVERYLASRGLALLDGMDVLRFHPRTPWQEDDGSIVYTPCMISCFRSIATEEITGMQRTRISPTGVKLGRKMTGVASGACIKIDDDSSVEQGICIAEGLETALTGRLFGLRPAWALGSAGAITTFPTLPGVTGIHILGETGKANADAVHACGRRWRQVGAEVLIVRPKVGSDINDALKMGAA